MANDLKHDAGCGAGRCRASCLCRSQCRPCPEPDPALVRMGSRDRQFQLRLLHPSAVHGGRVGQWRSVRTQFTCGVWGPAAAPPLAINLRWLSARLHAIATSGNAVVMEKASMLAIAIPPPAAPASMGRKRGAENTTHRSAYWFSHCSLAQQSPELSTAFTGF